MPLVWTSRWATPAAFTAARTLFISSAFWRMALLPSAAWVTTPADRVAISGARLACAWVETDSSVASVGSAAGAWAWTTAGLDRARRASRVARGVRMGLFSLGYGATGTGRAQRRSAGMNAR